MRPEGWFLERSEWFDRNQLHGAQDQNEGTYEAGADAMLEGLKKGATRVNNLGDLPQGKGVIVFILEEER